MTEHALPMPLRGYRIIDLTTFLSGPFCTQILADLGADVVKIEPPEGDSSRHIPPHFVGQDSAYFLASNRNKRSISVDLKTEEGQNLVRALIEKADVVVDNYRPGVLARLNLDPAKLTKDAPALIWASISGFGQTGPWRDRPAYDLIVQAEAGVMSLTGEPDRPSVRLGIPAGDTVAGLYAAIAVNAALADRERTGLGRIIDVSMLDCQLAMLSYQSAYALIAGVTPRPQGARHDSIPTYRAFVAADGRQLAVTANTDRMWRGLCQVLGLSELIDDPRFQNGAKRLENRKALWEHLERAFLAHSAEEWVARLEDADVPAALIKTVPEALQDAQTSGRGMISAMEKADGTKIEVVGNPIKITGAALATDRYPPSLGGDLASVMQDWLGQPEEPVKGQ